MHQKMIVYRAICDSGHDVSALENPIIVDEVRAADRVVVGRARSCPTQFDVTESTLL